MSKSKTTIAQVTEWFLRHLWGLPQHTPKCAICGEHLFCGQRIDWDHVHPEGLDGPHEIGNLRPLHHDCHKGKTKRDVRAIAKTKGTRASKFQPIKLPIDQERPERRGFGRKPFFGR